MSNRSRRTRSLPIPALLAALCCLLVPSLPAASAASPGAAVAQLDASPRHHEWIEVPAGDHAVRSFVVHPQKKENALTVIVIHENRGLTDWVRSFADQVAAAGYLAIAPDLLSGFDAKHRHTGDFESADAARSAIYELDPKRVRDDLLAVRRHVAKIPSANGEVVAAGFCWGGGQAFRMATYAPGLSATLVFYGPPPEDASSYGAISAPVYGFYGGNDQRINATIPETKKRMKAEGKAYEVVIYEGAGHAFMRNGDDPEGPAADRKAREAAWKRLLEILGGGHRARAKD